MKSLHRTRELNMSLDNPFSVLIEISMSHVGDSNDEISSYMRTCHEELTQDQRIEYVT